MTETIFDTEFAHMVYYPDKKIVHHTFHRHSRDEDLQYVLNTGLEFIAAHGVVKWLSDDRKLGGFTEEDARWTMVDWLPRALDVGWKYWALVVPDVASARADFLPLIQNPDISDVKILLFSDIDEAMEWLESQR